MLLPPSSYTTTTIPPPSIEQQKNELGEQIYPIITAHLEEAKETMVSLWGDISYMSAGKLTGMILQLTVEEIKDILQKKEIPEYIMEGCDVLYKDKKEKEKVEEATTVATIGTRQYFYDVPYEYRDGENGVGWYLVNQVVHTTSQIECVC
jgi:hypothetical protein